MRAPYDGGSIDAVGGIEREDVAFLPVPECFQSFAKIESSGANLGIRVGARGIGVGIDYCVAQ